MPNILDADGLQVQSRDELVTYFTAKYQQIYGNDINLGSDTPDGQMMNIYIQAILDIEDLLVQIYNSFDPDNAVGKVLDQRVAINGIQRQAGTYTITPITVVNSQSINLYGLDQDEQEVYTVADNAGNRWELQETQLGLSAGSHILSFQAAVPGAQLTVPNTITVPVTIVLGVVSVNNPTTYTTLGINEESDAVLKVRRQKSVSLASQGYLAGLLAALENITGVTSAFVYENTTNSTDSDGVPGHSIWVIVGGTAADADIAQAIYTKRNAGCGMYGETSYVVTQIDGSPFVIYWDTVIIRNMFIAFTVTSIDGVVSPNIQAIREGLVTKFNPGVNEEVNINQLGTYVQEIDDNTLVTNAGFSTGSLQTLTLSGTPASGVFKLNYNGNQTANINWNDNEATVQSKVQAVPGLESCIVVGSPLAGTIALNTTGIGDVDIVALVYASDNTLQTGGAVAITFSYNEDYANTLLPPTKRNQFIVQEENIVIVPMQLVPVTSQAESAETIQFSAYGGYGPYTFSISVNNSSGSINASTGLYTAGAVASVTDTIKVVDAFGNQATAVVTVI